MFSKLTIATLLSAVTLGASAASAAPAAKPAAEPSDSPQVVCTTERTLGSHLPKRTCMTQAARDERTKRDQEALRNMHAQPKSMGTGR